MRAGKRPSRGLTNQPFPTLLCGLLVTALLVGCESPRGDFNGDGAADLAVGIPFRNIAEVEDAGAVEVLYGSPGSGRFGGGLLQLWSRQAPGTELDPAGLPEPAREGDRYGSSLAVGDFDDDGYADLAVGVPSETVKGRQNAGAVNLLYGGSAGLTASGSELWYQDKQGIEGQGAPYDLFGFALAVGNFDGDLYQDLAIGVPLHDTNGIENVGAVNIIYGGLGGLSETRNQIWHEVNLNLEILSIDNRFGETLATGDFNGDGLSDLAVGAPNESNQRHFNIGTVTVIYGSGTGLTRSGVRKFSQADRFVMGGDLDNTGDRFGSALAAGDFDGNGLDDLAIGTPLDDWGELTDSGTVNVLYSTPEEGLSDGPDQIWHQNVRGTGLVNAENNNYGTSLTTGDFNGDGYADMAVGIPGYANGELRRAGAVQVLYGSEEGLSPSGSQVVQKSDVSLGVVPQAGDEFGVKLASSDLNGDGIDDLIVSANGGLNDAPPGAGSVHLLFGSAGGLGGAGAESLSADAPPLPGGAQPEEFYGTALAGAESTPAN